MDCTGLLAVTETAATRSEAAPWVAQETPMPEKTRPMAEELAQCASFGKPEEGVPCSKASTVTAAVLFAQQRAEVQTGASLGTTLALAKVEEWAREQRGP